MLGASGYIAGVINPPAKRKRNHWVGKAGGDPQAWLEAARLDRAAGGRPGPNGSPNRRRAPRSGPAAEPHLEPHRRQACWECPPPLFTVHPLRDSMTDIVIVAAARTAVGRFGGTLAKTAPPTSARM